MSKTAKAILWICSGPLVLLLTAMLQVIVRFAIDGSGNAFINIVAWVMGFVGLCLLVAGPIVGIIMLTKRNSSSK